MLLGVLRAPTPEPDNIMGIHQLADRARQAADEIERLTAQVERRDKLLGRIAKLQAAQIERFRERHDKVLERIAKLEEVVKATRSYDNSKSTEHGYRLYKALLASVAAAEVDDGRNDD